jgi:UDP-N-acetylmuramoyl-L-alanyl-D-glutamate--2,6-diaminopimelate ligase
MQIKYLNDLIPVGVTKDYDQLNALPIKRIVYDSRKVAKDSLFVAIRGFKTDGHKYLKEAESKGAVAAVVEIKNKQVQIPQIVVKNSRHVLAEIAARFYSPILSRLQLVGITGTNGKTTTSFLVQAILNAAGIECGLVGTIVYNLGDKLVKAWNTTPESVDLYEMLYSMYNNGMRGCALEVSSHALALNRIDSLELEVGVFINLTQDHLDFHKNFEEYFLAKKKLFTHLRPTGQAVVNMDDAYGRKIISSLHNDVRTFGFTDKADVHPHDWKSTLEGLKINFATPNGMININSTLIGKFNVENIMAAIAAGLSLNFDLETIKIGVENLKSVPGRLETIKFTNNRTVIIDYAHTPDALEKALKVLHPQTSNKLWVVFGCGGDRDKQKRSLMGKIAQDYSDHVIITTDNPRNESPEDIISDILKGITKRNDIYVKIDRRQAIEFALKNSLNGDAIIIAGKGHEDYQEIKGIKYPFKDRSVIEEYVQ